jgi:hypothetical protein
MAVCAIHKKNRKFQFLEPIPGSNNTLYRCAPGNECQTGHNTLPVPEPLPYGFQVTPLADLNPHYVSNSPQHPSINSNYQECNVHHKVRGVQYMEQYQAEDGCIAYKCKEGDSCKVRGGRAWNRGGSAIVVFSFRVL